VFVFSSLSTLRYCQVTVQFGVPLATVPSLEEETLSHKETIVLLQHRSWIYGLY